MKEYVPIFFDWVEVTEELTAQEKGRLIDAIVLYAQGGDWQEQIKGNERYLFPAFRKQIDRANEISEVRADARRGKTNENKAEENVSNRKKTPNNNNNNKEEDKENNNKGNIRLRFAPPTLDEVSAYCKERGNRVDPQKWWDFYASKGWKVGNNPMKDWQASVRTWEREDNGKRFPAKADPRAAQNYSQRTYSNDLVDLYSDTEVM